MCTIHWVKVVSIAIKRCSNTLRQHTLPRTQQLKSLESLIAIHERRPVHIHLPIDVAMTEIEVDSEYDVAPIPDVNVDRYINMVVDKLRSASQPVIITGHEINSFHLHKALEQFVNQTHIPVAQLSLGKGRLTKRIHII